MRFASLTLLAISTLSFTACDLLKPKDQTAAYDPYAQQTNPYSQSTPSNPYSQAPTNPYGSVPQTPATNPYGGYEQPQTSSTPTAPPYSSTPSTNYAPPTSSGSGRTVTVKGGDTLTSIAKRNGTNVTALRSANSLSGDLIRVGQKLNLP